MRTAASACVLCALGCTLIASCTASAEDVRPPPDQLFFPSGLAVSPPGNAARALFVANANSELRYDSGSINVISLDVVSSVVQDWLDDGTLNGEGHGDLACEVDRDHRETLVCDEAPFIRADAGVRIGNFASDIAVQDFTDPGIPGVVNLRVIVPTRGDPSVAWADYNGERLVCGDDDGFALCDDRHRLSAVLNDPDLGAIVDEPFGVFATTQPPDPRDPGGPMRGFAVVTHLTTGAVSLIDAPQGGTVQISDVAVNLFAPDQIGLRGTTGVAGRTPGTDDNIIYIGSRSESRIETLTIGRPENRTPPYLLPSNFFFLDGVGGAAAVGGSSDSRGLTFSPSGERLFVVNRRPPSIQIYDTSIGPTGVPNNILVGASDVCRQASSVAVLDLGTQTAPDERAYVTCFQDGELYVVDPRGQSQVEDIISVGRGPYAVAGAKDQKLLFVSNVLEDTIAVIDVDPTHPRRNRVVLRIGQPREP